MRALLLLSSLFVVGVATAAPPRNRGGDEQPIPYSDDPKDRYRPGAQPIPAADTDRYDIQDRETLYYRQDDPRRGLGAELMGGIMLLEASRGSLVDGRFNFGVRAIWEMGRLFPSDALKNSFFVDFSWSYSTFREGTTLINNSSYFHYFTVAPAWLFPLNDAATFGPYVQVGAGASLMTSVLNVAGASTPVTGFRPLFQYGVGFRATPALSDDGLVRLGLRLELTRYRRGYMDDTLIGGSVGMSF